MLGNVKLVLLFALSVGCGRIAFDERQAALDGAVDGVSSDGMQTLSAPSCLGLAESCGPAASASCCTSQGLPGGVFFRGYDVGTDNAFTDMTHPATIGPIQLDAYEVTVGRFRRFVEAGMGTQQTPPTTGAGARALNGAAAQAGWDPSWNANLAVDRAALEAALACGTTPTWTTSPAGNELRGITCVTWYEANAFCLWDGGVLPTDAEWRYAGAGGDEQRALPWSVPPSSLTTGSQYASYYDGSTCLSDGMSGCTITDILPVGTLPMGNARWGQADLSGNVCEWILDFYTPGFVDPCNNCALLTGTMRTIRGACIGGGSPRPAFPGGGYNPMFRDSNFGFRCARL